MVEPHGEYKGWPLLNEMPEGWTFCKTCGSPLGGYKFVTDGKSPLHGQKRALLRMPRPETEVGDGD